MINLMNQNVNVYRPITDFSHLMILLTLLCN